MVSTEVLVKDNLADVLSNSWGWDWHIGSDKRESNSGEDDGWARAVRSPAVSAGCAVGDHESDRVRLMSVLVMRVTYPLKILNCKCQSIGLDSLGLLDIGLLVIALLGIGLLGSIRLLAIGLGSLSCRS